ncbi:MAG: aminotransferase class I/II-fold pyridoxal phosphate-dependent enzyme [Acidimicrobiia bacterium]
MTSAIVKNGLKWGFHDSDVLPAWVAEMDFGIAPSVAAALHDAVDRGDTGYFYPEALNSTAEAATQFWKRRLRWDVDPSRVFAVPDVVEGIRRAIIHLTRPGSDVLLPTPAYYPFFSMVERAGRSYVQVQSNVDESGRYTIDLAAVDREMANGAGSIVISNPWNPTGRVFSEGELSDLIELVRRHDARIVSDEIHAPLTYPGAKHIAASSLDPHVVITVTSASKAFNLPGLKCAQVVLTNDKDAELWSERFTFAEMGVGTFGLLANTVAYRDGDQWLESVVGTLDSNRMLLGELLETLLPRVTYRPPDATFLAWLGFGGYQLDLPAGMILENCRVALTEGAQFGPGGDRHARLNFATSPSVLTELVERMAAVVKAAG